MDPVEIGFFSSLMEESSKADESVGRFINGAKRNPTTMFVKSALKVQAVKVWKATNAAVKKAAKEAAEAAAKPAK